MILNDLSSSKAPLSDNQFIFYTWWQQSAPLSSTTDTAFEALDQPTPSTNLLIALRKGKLSCIEHPIDWFVSYH